MHGWMAKDERPRILGSRANGRKAVARAGPKSRLQILFVLFLSCLFGTASIVSAIAACRCAGLKLQAFLPILPMTWGILSGNYFYLTSFEISQWVPKILRVTIV